MEIVYFKRTLKHSKRFNKAFFHVTANKNNTLWVERVLCKSYSEKIKYHEKSKPSFNCLTSLCGNTDHSQLCFVELLKTPLLYCAKQQWRPGYCQLLGTRCDFKQTAICVHVTTRNHYMTLHNFNNKLINNKYNVITYQIFIMIRLLTH